MCGPEGSQFFHFYIPIFQKAVASELGTPYGKSWIRHNGDNYSTLFFCVAVKTKINYFSAVDPGFHIGEALERALTDSSKLHES